MWENPVRTGKPVVPFYYDIGVPPTPALTNVLVKIIVELLGTLALVTKEVKQGRFSEFVLVRMTL